MYKGGRLFPTPPSGGVSALDTTHIGYPASLTVGAPTAHDTLQEILEHIWSAGVTYGCDITDNADGTVSFTAGEAMLHATSDEHSNLYYLEVPAQASLAMLDESVNWVYLDFNGGSPQWVTSASRTAFNCIDKCLGYNIHRSGTSLNIIDAREQNVDSNRKIRQLFLQFSRFIPMEGGSVLGASTLALTVTAGSFYLMLQELAHDAFDTSVAGTANANIFTLWYRDGASGWTETASQKAIVTTTYDDNSGTPATLGNNKYGVSWVYLVHDDPSSLHVVMGQAEYNQEADAHVATPPTTLPGIIAEHGSLLGFVIYGKGDTSFADVLSTRTHVFTSSAATNHNNLAGLQGGAIGDYRHLTTAELGNIHSPATAGTGISVAGQVISNIDTGSGAIATHEAASGVHAIAATTGLQTVLDSKEPSIGAKNTAFNKDFGTTSGTVSAGDHNHSGAYEPIISPKNTGFNKDLGTTAGTVSEGNHTHALDTVKVSRLAASDGSPDPVLSSDVYGNLTAINILTCKNYTEVVPYVGDGRSTVTSVGTAYHSFFGLSDNTTPRWRVSKENDAETGSNAGSSFTIGRYSDGGIYQGAALTINRATGNIGVGVSPNTSKIYTNGTIQADAGLKLSSNKIQHNMYLDATGATDTFSKILTINGETGGTAFEDFVAAFMLTAVGNFATSVPTGSLHIGYSQGLGNYMLRYDGPDFAGNMWYYWNTTTKVYEIWLQHGAVWARFHGDAFIENVSLSLGYNVGQLATQTTSAGLTALTDGIMVVST